MRPESFFHVALKVHDLEESLGFYREHFVAEVVERGHASEALADEVEFVVPPPTFGDLRIAFFADSNDVRIELLEQFDGAT